MKLFHLQQSYVKASKILHSETIPVRRCKNWVKTISIFLIRKKFSCLSSCFLRTHKENHAYLTNSHYYRCLLNKYLPTTSVTEWTSTWLQNVWLLPLVNSSIKFSTIIDYFEIPAFLINEHNFSVSSIPLDTGHIRVYGDVSTVWFFLNYNNFLSAKVVSSVLFHAFLFL